MARELIPNLEANVSHINVLIVEDDLLMVKLLRSVAETLGFHTIETATDGKKALARLDAVPCDLIIADWAMQPMDGITLTRKIRERDDPRYRTVPIIMITGKSELRHMKKAKDAGITEYMVKPFTVPELCTRIATVLEIAPYSADTSGETLLPSRRV